MENNPKPPAGYGTWLEMYREYEKVPGCFITKPDENGRVQLISTVIIYAFPELLACVEAQAAELTQAKDELKKVDNNADQWRIDISIALANIRSGHYGEAIRILTAILKSSPKGEGFSPIPRNGH